VADAVVGSAVGSGLADRWTRTYLPILGLCNLHTTSWAGSLEAISPTIE
jgi:hypothetical protein